MFWNVGHRRQDAKCDATGIAGAGEKPPVLGMSPRNGSRLRTPRGGSDSTSLGSPAVGHPPAKQTVDE